jgi:Lipocalin-like domain
MNQRHIITLSTIAALGLALLPGSALSQEKSVKNQLVGTWTMVSQEQTLPNGSKLQPFGASPKGMLVFDANGRVYAMWARADLPKIASNNRLSPTPEEAKAIALGTLSTFGTYAVDEAKRTFTIRYEASTFANLDGTDGTYTVLLLAADELKYSFEPAGLGGQIVSAFIRAK